MIQLFEYPLSPYAQKMKITLRTKQIPFDLARPPGLGSCQADGAFAEGNPRREVPFLIDGDLRIFDSTIMLDYLDERWPTPPMMPDDPARRAGVRMIEAEHGIAAGHAADATDEAACAEMVRATVDSFGRLDGLVNNVGIGSRGSVVASSQADWQRVMRINVETMFLASISAIRPRGLTAYSTSKGAVIALTRAMAVDHGPEGIRVNCVAPGPVYTPMVHAGGMSDAARELRRNASVLKVEGTGWDVG
ncbi:MAG: SDR family oxidoreductase [Minwuia sp.]|nr:SDR family oxidoreductase [Minwuia sp.]